MFKKAYVGFGLALVLALASAASAQLVPKGALGPDSPSNGFPKYVKDINGVKLDLPTPPIGDGVTAPTMIFDPVIPDNPWSVATGFGAEAFFFLAESVINLPSGGRALVVMGIEAAYGAEDPRNDPPDQFLFARLRLRIDAPSLGTYTAITPWGNSTFTVTTLDTRNINHTFDWGGFAPIPTATPPVPSSVERILYSPTPWRFLKANTMAPGVDPNQWIGDGVTPSTITGGFNGVNVFRIEGPNIGGPGLDSIESNLFTVSGHIYTGPDEPRPNRASRVAVIPMF